MLLDHPGVVDAATVGAIRQPAGTEIPYCFVVRDNEHDMTEDTLKQALSGNSHLYRQGDIIAWRIFDKID